MLGIVLCLSLGEVRCTRMVDQKDGTNSDETEIAAGTSELGCPFSCAMKSDTVLARNAVGPSWIAWKTPCLPNADLAYVDLDTWDIWVMDGMGGNKRCLTCYNDNILGINFTLDDDGQLPAIHWKGDPRLIPTNPLFSLKRRMKIVLTENCGIRRVSAGTTIFGL